MLNKVFALLMIAAILLQFSCEMKSEKELYQEIMSIDKPQERVAELKNYLTKYPENKNKDKIYRQIFRDYIALNDETNVVIYADKYLNFFPKGYRMSELNGVAWTLAENKMGLDSAKVYADRAVEQADESGLGTLNNIKDTQAYVYFQAGDAKRALAIQNEAMTGNENDYDFLSRLGLYQHATGEFNNSYNTVAKSILSGGGLDLGIQLTDWLLLDIKDAKERGKVSKQIARESIKDFTKDGITEHKKSHSAVLLSVLKDDLKKAEKWAIEAAESLDGDSEFSQYLAFNINLASVYNALGNKPKVLSTLQKVEEYASIYDISYWLVLGNAYEFNSQKEKAVNAYISGMLWRKSPQILAAAVAQGLAEKEIDIKIENRKNELLDFHPGKYESNDNFSGRIVLTELFTGAECPPCKGADLSLDLIAEYYPRDMVALLEYHLHIPGPDPLTNPDSEARRQYYGGGFGTPTVFFNGQGKIVGGGHDLAVKDLFNKYKKSIEKYFSSKPEVDISLNANLKDDVITVESDIKFNSKAKNNLTVNIAIVEKSVDYIGGNGITKHAFVVRYLMTGAEGENMDLKSDSFKYSDSIKLSTIQDRQSKYLTDFEKSPPRRFRNFAGWKDRKDNLNIEQLALIAWVQNPETKEILQSQYSEL